MTAAASLRASSDAFFRMGREFDAIFSREMADQAERSGDNLFQHWAREQAHRVTQFAGDRAGLEACPPPHNKGETK